MKNLLPIALRALIVFVVLSIVVFLIPYYLLALASVGGGLFMLRTSDDKSTAWGLLLGGIVFGVVFFLRSGVAAG